MLTAGLLLILAAKANIHYDWLSQYTDKTVPVLTAAFGLLLFILGLCYHSVETTSQLPT